jgi:hypothetical protein
LKKLLTSNFLKFYIHNISRRSVVSCGVDSNYCSLGIRHYNEKLTTNEWSELQLYCTNFNSTITSTKKIAISTYSRIEKKGTTTVYHSKTYPRKSNKRESIHVEFFDWNTKSNY